MQGLHGPSWRLEKVEMHVFATVTVLSFRREVSDDKPQYRSTLRQVHTQIYSAHINTDRIEAQRPGLPVQSLLVCAQYHIMG